MSDWFEPGLAFSCTRCGNCCTGAPGYVWVNAQEIQQIAEFRGESTEETMGQFVRLVGTATSLIERSSGDCIFYDRDGRGCSIYPVRPRQCRTWPFWHSNLRSESTWDETCRICPGAGRGEFVPADEVRRRSAVIRL
jgi:hypothetical protein